MMTLKHSQLPTDLNSFFDLCCVRSKAGQHKWVAGPLPGLEHVVGRGGEGGFQNVDEFLKKKRKV